MKQLVACWLLACVCLGSTAAWAEQATPRDIWPQATAAAQAGDIDSAIKKSNELSDAAKNLGIRTFPIYAASAAALARQGDKAKDKAMADWAAKAADHLDPTSATVAFSKADRAADARQYGQILPAAFKGIGRVFNGYRSSLLSRADGLLVAAGALLVIAILFALTLFIRYGRAMGHDFREALATRFRGGAITVLAFALLFLPLFLWLGPLWLVFYWFVIFFGYATVIERVMIMVLTLALAATPIVMDLVSHWTAGVDSPVVLSAIASEEQSYYPGALHRMQELIGVAPGNATLQLLLGNLELQEGNEGLASTAYRRSLELKESAGAHVNLGNLHFMDNDFGAAITEYTKAEQLDPKLAIAFYNHSIASGELYKFDEQSAQFNQAKRIDRAAIEKLSANALGQKIVIYHPPIETAWAVAESLAKEGGAAKKLFGSYSWFDPVASALNPITLASLLTLIAAPLLAMRRKRTGFAGACIKCGRTFCHRCKSARESATYCTQCIHIYLKRDGVSLATKRAKLDEVLDHQTGIVRRNKIFATFFPGSAQLLEGRTITGILGGFLFALFVVLIISVGRLAPVLTGEVAKDLVRAFGLLMAIVVWVIVTLPVYKRRATT
jgi:tetratricopeptide (TPR) repeat protein